MIIAYTSDLHGVEHLYGSFFAKVGEMSPHVVLLGGDVGPKAVGSVESLARVQRQFWMEYLLPNLRKLSCQIGFILGNDDARCVLADIERLAPPNVFSLHKKIIKLDKCYVGGYSFTNRLPFRFKDWEKPEVVGDPPLSDPKFDLRTMPREEGTLFDDFSVLEKDRHSREAIWMIHVPPYNTALDVIHDYRHVGSKVVRSFIERVQPPLALHGHIHESPVMSGRWSDKIGHTWCCNAGSNPFDNQGWMILVDTQNPEKSKREALHEVKR